MDTSDTCFPLCNLCGSAEASLLFPDFELSPSGDRGIVRCCRCGLVYRNIRKTQKLLEQDYRQADYLNLSKDWMEGRKSVFRPYMKALSKFRMTSNILDIGAGHGFFLAACREEGWNCQGTELAPECRAFAEREFGFQIDTDTRDGGKYKNNAFDIVTFWNVLDHLIDPKAMLTEIHRLLRPGGLVWVRSPNAVFHVTAKRFFIRMAKLGFAFPSLDHAVFHLVSFDQSTLSRMFREVGFENERIRPATLSWTTNNKAEASFLRTWGSVVAGIGTQCIYALTGKRLLLSPSMIARATKCLES